MNPVPQTQHQPTDADPPEDFAGDNDSERSDRVGEREYASADRGYREAIEDERGGVICQPFAFEDDKDSPRKLQSASDRERRHSVRRRNNGAQYEAHRPSETQQPMGCRGDRDRR